MQENQEKMNNVGGKEMMTETLQAQKGAMEEEKIVNTDVSSHEDEMDQEQLMKMYEETFQDYQRGEILEGTVMDVRNNEVLVDIGGKTEGIIDINEFDKTPVKDDKVHVFVIKNPMDGKVKLSKKRADYVRNWEKLEAAYNQEEIIEGVLKKRIKGGAIIEILGVDAFLPTSQVGLKPIPNLDQFLGKTFAVKIIKLNRDKRNVVVSRKVVLEKEMKEKKEDLLNTLEEGRVVVGVVKNITDYGAFVDLEGLDGLLHITDMSWGRIDHPSEMLQIGSKIEVKVLKFDKDTEKISLGMKQLTPHPWENIQERYPEGATVSGKVVNITDFGAFLELEKGVEGLIHNSEMSWLHNRVNANDFVKKGEAVKAIVLKVDEDHQRISLGLKQMTPNPWLTIDLRYPVGTELDGKVKNFTPFGAFVEIEDGIDGLIHISDLSWTKRISHPSELLKVGETVHVCVLDIDKQRHRISLGLKQTQSDPWENLEEIYPVNSETEGTISKIIEKGVLVNLDNGVEAFVPLSHLNYPGLKSVKEAFRVEDRIPLKVIELDKENRRMILSVKAYFFGKSKEEVDDYLTNYQEETPETSEESNETEE